MMFRIKRATSISLICIATLSAGIGTYVVESMVDDREKKIRQLNTQIKEEKERITVLEADWSYLTRPSRIQSLSKDMLSFAPIEPQRILNLEMLDGDEAGQGETGLGNLYQINIIEDGE